MYFKFTILTLELPHYFETLLLAIPELSKGIILPFCLCIPQRLHEHLDPTGPWLTLQHLFCLTAAANIWKQSTYQAVLITQAEVYIVSFIHFY